MGKVVVAGGSVAGLACALALAKRGIEVVVAERAAAPPEGPIDEVVASWDRPTVPQAHHSHTLTSAGVAALRAHAPEVLAAATDAGAVLLDLVKALPHGTPDAGDDELRALACRRTTFELVLYRAARAAPGVTIRHGARVRGLDITGDRVTGVIVHSGHNTGTRAEIVPTDTVIDATGRRAEARAWLAAAGFPLPPDLSTPSGFLGYSRFYRRQGPPLPLNRGNAAGIVGDRYAGVLHPGDGDTFSIAMAVLPEDTAMRSLRHADDFTAAAIDTPGLAPWLADARPISPVRAINCPPNLLRAAMMTPPVEGVYPVGDAACVTNPLYGRGMSLALVHAFRLAETLSPAVAMDIYPPWYEQAGQDDAERIARWRASIEGQAPPAMPRGVTLRSAGLAARHDPTVWRGVMRVLMSLAPPGEVFAEPDFEDRVLRALSADQLATPAGKGR